MIKSVVKLLFGIYLKISRYRQNIRSFKNLWQPSFKKNLLTKKQQQDIDNFYRKYYGKKISYKEHNLIMNYNQQFDIKYIPTKLFLKFVDSLNTSSYRYDVFKDKNFLYNIANLAQVKIPKRYFYSIGNLLFDSNNNIISKQDFYKQIENIGEVFIKPTVDSGGAKGCRIINVINGMETNTDTSVESFFNKYYKKDFVIQEKLSCHESISKIYSKSVNTFIVFTYIWNNEIKTLSSILKLGTNGSIVDFSNSNKDGLFMAINNDGFLSDAAFCSEHEKKYFEHPNTKITFKNYKIDLFPKVLQCAKKLHSVIPWLGFCKWDMTIDKQGNPTVIEMEKSVSSLFLQIATGKSMFEENTSEIFLF